MKSLSLDFTQRLQLINLLSMQEGTLGKLAPYMRILESIRFSEEEDRQVVRTPLDGGNRVAVAAPNPEFGKITVQIEHGDATCLEELIANWPRFTAQDGVWVIPLQKALKLALGA